MRNAVNKIALLWTEYDELDYYISKASGAIFVAIFFQGVIYIMIRNDKFVFLKRFDFHIITIKLYLPMHWNIAFCAVFNLAAIAPFHGTIVHFGCSKISTWNNNLKKPNNKNTQRIFFKLYFFYFEMSNMYTTF